MNEFSDILIKIQKSEYLSREDIKFAYNFILDGKANDIEIEDFLIGLNNNCLLYTSPSPRDPKTSRMPSSA